MGTGDGFIVRLGGFQDTASPYVTLKNLIIDGSATVSGTDGMVNVGSDYQRLDGVEIRNAPRIPYANLATAVSYWADGTEFLNCKVHNNPGRTDGVVSGYGFYITGTNTLIDNCDIYNNGGYAVHIFDSGSNSVSGNIVRNSRIWNNNGTGTVPHQIIISSGSKNQVYNNIINSPAKRAGAYRSITVAAAAVSLTI